jgi:hypothetical protein
MAKELNDSVYRLLVKHGAQHSVELAQRLDETPRAVTNALTRLRLAGRITKIATVRHPEFRGAQLAIWQAIPVNQQVEVKPPTPRYRTPANMITEEDLAWMKAIRERAEWRKQRIVRG